MPNDPLIEPEQLGKMIAEVTRLAEQNRRMAKKLEELGAQVARLVKTRTQGTLLLQVGRWATGIAITGLLTGAGWIYNGYQEHDRLLVQHTTKLIEVEDRMDRHERGPGHDILVNSVSDVRGDVRGLQATLEAMQETLNRMDERMERRR